VDMMVSDVQFEAERQEKEKAEREEAVSRS
jgi:hypothetical protein